MDYRTVADLAACIRTRSAEIVPKDIDLVVGIAPSGMIAANLIALRLNLQVTDVQGYPATRGRKGAKSGAKHILLVDDSVTTGRRCEEAKKSLSATVDRYGDRVTTLAVYSIPGAQGGCDLTLEEVSLPRLFEWNYMHHAILSDSCISLEGVLCPEPAESANDDDLRYRKFIKAASPLVLPSVEIGTIVSCRFEKYKTLTENWLQSHGVRYRNLILMNTQAKATDDRPSSHWQFKAESFKHAGGRLFIDSDPREARAIAKHTNLPVLCVGSNEMLRP